MTTKQTVLGMLVGVGASLIVVPVLGFLSFHERSRREGLGFSWDLGNISVGEPRRTLLPVLGIIVFSALLTWMLLWVSTRAGTIARGWPLAAAGATLLVIVLLTTLMAPAPDPDTLELSKSGFLAYLRTGATGSVPAVLGTVLCVLSVFAFRGGQLAPGRNP
ncbi:hypothetical protein M2390_002347 [Mycetocola sp. BIGb0189]|uniref:hypothetical protein n=1 Tax=Mycetocola sp. BIGb0189 TaxID=2940604 RepID=UPI002168633D|nr:hypothetical protein [Mycetocola sp. BIGb0189]MCS4277143.1 hypothetical protein [Mycetocola sp. BIGb0189]